MEVHTYHYDTVRTIAYSNCRKEGIIYFFLLSDTPLHLQFLLQLTVAVVLSLCPGSSEWPSRGHSIQHYRRERVRIE